MNEVSADDLRQQGYTVRVKHVRRFDNVGMVVPGEMTLDNFITKGEYLRAQESGNLQWWDTLNQNSLQKEFVKANALPYGRAVSPVGGFTLVEIFDKEQLIASAKRNFGRKEAYNKKKGLFGALRRAVEKLHQDMAANN